MDGLTSWWLTLILVSSIVSDVSASKTDGDTFSEHVWSDFVPGLFGGGGLGRAVLGFILFVLARHLWDGGHWWPSV
jgi:hypothetical protein